MKRSDIADTYLSSCKVTDNSLVDARCNTHCFKLTLDDREEARTQAKALFRPIYKQPMWSDR